MSRTIIGDANVSRNVNTVRANERLTQVTGGGTEVFSNGKSIEVTAAAAAITRELPSATTGNLGATALPTGWVFEYINNGTGTLTIASSGGTALSPTIASGRSAKVILLDNSTVAGRWKVAVEDNPTGSVTSHVQPFNATTDWSSTATNGLFTLSVTNLVHGKGPGAIVQVQSGSAFPFTEVGIDYAVATNGDITISAPSSVAPGESTDGRFAGRMVIL